MFGKLSNTASSFFQNHWEVVVLLLLWTFYFLTLQVDWEYDWLSRALPEKGFRPISALVYPLVFFINGFYLIPKYLKQKKWWHYGILIIIMGVFFELLRAIWFVGATYGFQTGFFTTIFSEYYSIRQINDPVTFGIMISCAYVFTKDWMTNIGVVERLKAEKLSTELSFLKSQVDPHFLFNTLNTLYALALEEKGHKTADGIAKLGTLMRYNLHDSQVELIALSKEVAYLQKYIELQRLRTTKESTIDIQVELNEAELSREKIAPMLLIPFIENAFKYGISPVRPSFIKIRLAITDDFLHFMIKNSIIEQVRVEEHGGVGIQNAKKRLEITYPEKHDLKIIATDTIFEVQLQIDIKSRT